MAFPVTISSVLSSAEQPGKYGPYLVGANRYEILLAFNAGAGTVQLVAAKSTDGGVTWNAVGSGPVPYWSGPGTVCPYACCQQGSTIWVVYYDNGLGALAIVSFAADTWGTPSAIPSPPNGAFPSAGDGGGALHQYALAYSPFDGTIIFVMAGDLVTLTGVDHLICSFARFTIAGATWSAWIDLGYTDYADITTWDQVPAGIVIDPATGAAVCIMQQVSRAGPGTTGSALLTGAGAATYTVPLDAGGSAQIECWGAGAGPSGAGGAVTGGGGGGAYSKKNSLSWTAGGAINYDIGGGGAAGFAGGDTWFSSSATVKAQGGKVGASASLGGNGGSAGSGVGDVTTSGGKGGDGNVGGGGGGGAAGPLGNGGAGGDGAAGPSGGGASGSGNPPGGDGGGGGAVTFPGTLGNPPGGGAGGYGSGSPMTPEPGADGQIVLTWTTVRNTHPSRVWQQRIRANNSLGTLSQITQGAYPSRAQGVAPIPISLDVAISTAGVSIAITGATSTTAETNISVGQGVLADPVVFSFQTFSSGNGGNTRDSSPALAAGAAGLYCCYISAPTGSNVLFDQRLDAGAGFGAATLIGSLATGDVHEFSRLQANCLVSLPEITWGTPLSAVFAESAPT